MKPTFLLALLLSMNAGFAQQPSIHRLDGSTLSTGSIDKLVAQLMDTAHVTGLELSILNGKTITYTKAYGLKNNTTKEPLDTGSVFCAASLSKAAFAFICMLLVQEGKLDLDKPLYQYIPKPLPVYERYTNLARDDQWKLLTARMCLSHTTGFPNWRFLNVKTGDYDSSGKLAIYFKPGTRYAYSGEGIALLQLVIEEIMGRDLEAIAREKLFVPAGMGRSSYVWQPSFENDFAYGHTQAGEVLGKKKRKRPGAAGSLETTVADYARFTEYVLRQKGLNQQWMNEMLKPQVRIHSKQQFPTITDRTSGDNDAIQLSYGLGWGLMSTPYGKAFFKEGHDEDGWQHYCISFPDKGTSMLIMSNSLNAEKIFKDLLEKIIGDHFTPWRWEQYWPYNYTVTQGN